jgi:hypothetical protein
LPELVRPEPDVESPAESPEGVVSDTFDPSA